MRNMRDWIAFVMAVLGAALVVAGAAVILIRALKSVSAAKPVESAFSDDTTIAGAKQAKAPGFLRRFWRSAMALESADRLIAWGVVLLLLGALAAGAIGFNLQLSLGNK